MVATVDGNLQGMAGKRQSKMKKTSIKSKDNAKEAITNEMRTSR